MAERKAPAPDNAAQSDQLGELRKTVETLQAQLEDQGERLQNLVRGREKSMQEVADLRAELALVSAERDKLRTALTALEDMQTETVALDEDEAAGLPDPNQLTAPSIDDLMSTFSGRDNASRPSHSTVKVETEDAIETTGEYQEMISPELIVLGSPGERARSGTQKFLVLLDGDGHRKFPLDQELMTIGRSDSADIQVEADFVSRIHARVLRVGMDTVIEDAGSRNGTRVNAERVQRHVLKHGDLVRVGSATFRYVDVQSGKDPIE